MDLIFNTYFKIVYDLFLINIWEWKRKNHAQLKMLISSGPLFPFAKLI